MTAIPCGALLTVDLDAVIANWRLIAARLAPPSRAAAVVKADGYGLGARPVASALSRAGCRRFFVATLAEAIDLRGALPDDEIFVMNGLDQGSVALYRRHHLIPTLNSVAQAREWQVHGAGQAAALQVDSGMSRLGMGLDEADILAQDAEFRRAVPLILLMSHLACADHPDHPQNRAQWQRFERARALFPGVESSLAASSGVFLGPNYHSDWVRPGAALYGINPIPGRPNPMAQVVRLQAKIMQGREIDGGIGVGYGASHHTTGRTRLATVAIGYADGLMRVLGNRGHGRIGDKLVPLVGRVSMDLTIFDVTDIDPALTGEGSWIDLIGPMDDIDQMAQTAGTIGYEILTSLGERIHRHYRGAES